MYIPPKTNSESTSEKWWLQKLLSLWGLFFFRGFQTKPKPRSQNHIPQKNNNRNHTTGPSKLPTLNVEPINQEGFIISPNLGGPQPVGINVTKIPSKVIILPETNIDGIPKGNEHLSTIHFQGQNVSFRESISFSQNHLPTSETSKEPTNRPPVRFVVP